MISNGCIKVNIEIQQLLTITMFEMEYFVTLKLKKLNQKAIL